MTRFVALLRGVNVGGAKRVPMADLRALLSTLGYSDVRTLLNSGNAVFESAGRSASAHATRIQAAIAETLSVDVPVIVKSAKELAAIEAENGLACVATDPSRLLVAFTGETKALQSLALLKPLVTAPEQLFLGRHAMYLWCANGILARRPPKRSLASPEGRPQPGTGQPWQKSLPCYVRMPPDPSTGGN